MNLNSAVPSNEADKKSGGIIRHDNINICYIGGGSQGWAWKLMSDLYLEEDILCTEDCADVRSHCQGNKEILSRRLGDKLYKPHVNMHRRAL